MEIKSTLKTYCGMYRRVIITAALPISEIKIKQK